MRKVASLCLSTILLAAHLACSDDPVTASFAVQLKWMPAVTPCDFKSTIGANMDAVLDIGGHNRCELDVDPSTLVVSGECDEITIGIIRPLGLEYSWTEADLAETAHLAYLIGMADLRKETLASDTTEVEVNLTGDGVSSALLDEEQEALDLPDVAPGVDDCRNIVDEKEKDFCRAKAWGKDQITERGINFDKDGDDQSNLQEACNDTLWE
ncbi:hypothetical protein ACFL6C_06960 [Myxococcota bacterium]